jgi:hypothetical protein
METINKFVNWYLIDSFYTIQLHGTLLRGTKKVFIDKSIIQKQFSEKLTPNRKEKRFGIGNHSSKSSVLIDFRFGSGSYCNTMN